jgi:O-antigen/teichoic acid export membrane protein
VASGRAWQPRLAAAATASDLGRAYARALKLSLLAGAALTIGLLAATPLFLYAYGDAFRDAAPAYMLLCAVQALLFVTQLNYILLVARGRAATAAAAIAVALAANVAANLVLIPPLGALGAAIAMLVSECVLLAAQARAVRSELVQAQGAGQALAA